MDGGAWSETHLLTAGAPDDVDPRIFSEPDNTLHVVWWTDGAVTRVLLATKPAASSVWDVPVEVASGGRRPSVAISAGVLRVSYERDSSVPGLAQDVVVVRREAEGGFTEEFVASTDHADPLESVLHSTLGKTWIDWKHGDGAFGCSEHGPPGWGNVEGVSWTDPTWVGVEATRRLIEVQVLGN
jgi:hypothetical protein